MKRNIKKLFQESLKLESDYDKDGRIIESNNDKSTLSHLDIFKKQCSNIHIFPLDPKENNPLNYSKYLEKTLTHISQLKDIKFEYALEDEKIKEGVPNLSFDKKILILDLDETLIHADFDEEFPPDEYDTIIQFKSKKEKIEQINEKTIEDSESTSCCLSDAEEDEIHKVGIFIRNGVKYFLEEVNKYFEVGIFTASVKEYADAVISFLDPENKLIKFRLYRNNCINFNDSFTIKDLRIIPNADMKKIVLLDNSMYSFCAQINNGILINYFFNDKKDTELYNALEYLIKFILPAEDVREVNEQFFNFQRIINDIVNVDNF
jgi:Dullard-like phosphatase family protein